MPEKVISKILEIDNCPKEKFLKAIYRPKIWEQISPVTKIEAEFVAPNVLFSKITDNIKLIKIPIDMEGELVLNDRGEEEEKGRLIEFNVRKNKDVKELEGNLRVKELTPTQSKIGIFIHHFTLSSDFMRLFGGAAELVLRTKITDMMRNLEKLCKNQDLSNFI